MLRNIFVNPFGQQIIPGLFILGLVLLTGCGSGSGGAGTQTPISPNLSLAMITSPDNGDSFLVNNVIPFKGNSTNINGAVSYFWDFGDGETSTQQIMNYSYSFPGTYTVSLTITDASGGQERVSISITVVSIADEATLTVTKNGTGSGTISSIPFGINCGANEGVQNSVSVIVS